MSETLNPPANNEPDWPSLIRRIKWGNCILLLGTQVSINPDESDLLPLTTRLAHYLANNGEFADDKDLVSPDDIAHVAQLFQQKHDRLELEEATGEFYAAYKDKTTDFHRDMAALPFTLCINTTPDSFFSNALIAAGKEPVRDYYNFRRARPFASIQPTIDKPYIYNLYGHCDDPESLVLAEDDLLECLVRVIKGNPELPPFIRSQFANPDINFLFVGFGFRSWHNRILLHALNTHNHYNQSLAVEDQNFYDYSDCFQIVKYYASHYRIKFEQLSCQAFAKKSRFYFHNPSALVKAPTSELPTKNKIPKVFLCYATEDRSTVEWLRWRLQKEDIELWQDDQNLRPGDNWDRRLMQVIENEVDYVVVVQTPAMTDQFEGYFFKEIAAALDRQKKFSTKVRFILPIMLSDCNLLEELHDFHTIRIDDPEGLRQFIDAIKTDWQQRRKQTAARARS